VLSTPTALIRDIAGLVAIPSISCVAPDRDLSNRPVVDHLANRLEDRGFDVMIQELAGTGGKANLIATLGSGPGGLVLAGHTDTVPCDPPLWSSDPFTLVERDQRLYGLGTCDMKSFLALAMHAAEAVEARRQTAPLVIVATADEESTMAGARALAAAGRPTGRFAVIGEPTGMLPVRMHKGIFTERIIIRGRSGHSSDPGLGRSALDGMYLVIGALMDWREELARIHVDASFGVPHPTLNLGRIAGGDNPNRICGRCELDIDLRTLPGMDLAGTRAALRERASRAISGSGLRVGFEALMEGVPAMHTPLESDIVTASESLTGSPAGAVAFATEAPFLAALGTEVIVLGPGSVAQAHQPDEFLELERIPKMLEYLRALARRFCMQ
jgi:acetylornithine deacetylase